MWDDYVKRYPIECKTNKDVPSCAYNKDNGVSAYDTRPVMEKLCFPLAPSIIGVASDLSGAAGSVNDLKGSMWLIIGSIGFSILAGIILMFLTAVIVDVIFWIVFVGSVVMLYFVAFVCFYLSFSNFFGSRSKTKGVVTSPDSYPQLEMAIYSWKVDFSK